MRKILHLAAVGAFLLGTIVVPALHLAAVADVPPPKSCCPEGQEESGTPPRHDAAHCSICQIAHMPMAVAVADIAPLAAPPVKDVTRPCPSAPLCRSDRKLPFPCGPPARVVDA